MADDVKIRISDEDVEDYKKQCTQWSPVFLRLPIATANDVLKYYTHVTKLRGKKKMPSIWGKSQFGPFKKNRSSEANVDIEWRTLETFHGNVVESFAPVDYVDIPLGLDSTYIGEKLKNAPQSVLVMGELSASRGQFIAQGALTGKRDADGNTTEEIADGLLTIAKDEIKGGNISEAKGNLYVMKKALTFENCCDELKKFVFSMDPFLRTQNNFLFCAPEVVDMYNESYLLTHQAVSYNKEYDQPYVEGSSNKLTLVGLPQLAGTDIMFATQKKNLLFGTYLESDQSFVDIMRKNHYELSMASDMWIGFNFRTLDKRVIKFIQLAEPADEKVPAKDPEQGENNDNNG